MNEIGKRADTGDIVIRIDKRYFRPTEVDQLMGDSKKAFKKLGWEPNTSLIELISEMITKDKEDALKNPFFLKKGFKSIAPKDG